MDGSSLKSEINRRRFGFHYRLNRQGKQFYLGHAQFGAVHGGAAGGNGDFHNLQAGMAADPLFRARAGGDLRQI